MLVIRRIHVRLKLKAEESHWETANRVHGLFADKCPIYRSLKPAIAMTTELFLEPPPYFGSQTQRSISTPVQLPLPVSEGFLRLFRLPLVPCY